MSPSIDYIRVWLENQDPVAVADLAGLVQHGYGQFTLVVHAGRLTGWIPAKHKKPKDAQKTLLKEEE